jgi:hypothetical protein
MISPYHTIWDIPVLLKLQYVCVLLVQTASQVSRRIIYNLGIILLGTLFSVRTKKNTYSILVLYIFSDTYIQRKQLSHNVIPIRNNYQFY